MQLTRPGAGGTAEHGFERENWGLRVPDDQWAIYRRVIGALQAHGIGFALGGAFALAAYSNYWRNTKDLDLYILEEDRDRVVAVLDSIGLGDYHAVEPYDRGWIYRAHQGEVIVDAIFGMPNRRASCDRSWLNSGPQIQVRDKRLRVVPPDRLIWAKIYVMQRPRCDWPDIMNVVYGAGHTVDWDRLITSLGEDLPLLQGIMATFAWLAPGRAQLLDRQLWERLGLPVPGDGAEFEPERVRRLESRPWFAPLIERETSSNGNGAVRTHSEDNLRCSSEQ